MTGLTGADRVVALLEWGDVAEADAAIEARELESPHDGQVLLWRGARALMEGRFHACEQLAAAAVRRGEESGDSRATALGTLLVVALRREQQRPAEAEIVLRGLPEGAAERQAGVPAVLAAVLAQMGRDSQAYEALTPLVPTDPVPATGRLGVLFQLADVAAVLGATGEAELLYRRLVPHPGDFAVEEGGAVFYGSVSMALGRLAQATGRWDEAVRHLDDGAEAHVRAGAPLLLAHTHRHQAALLRARGDPGDWERGVDLLDAAGEIYRQLGVDRLAAETQVVLARSEDGARGPADQLGEEPQSFLRRPDGWLLGPVAERVRLRDAPGLRDIARLLNAPGRELHVLELLQAPLTSAVLDPTTRAEYEGRLAEVAGELVEAERGGDRIQAALARAERDALASALAQEAQEAQEGGDALDRACRVVSTRIRISVDHIERAHPPLGHHLRRSIRTGTFCSYDPARPVRWVL